MTFFFFFLIKLGTFHNIVMCLRGENKEPYFFFLNKKKKTDSVYSHFAGILGHTRRLHQHLQ